MTMQGQQDTFYLGQYEVGEVIGKGGMGTVYRARQTSLNRDVAVKILPSDLAQAPGYLERFSREAEVAGSLEHPNIIPILDYGTQKGTTYVVMRLLTGGTLQDRIYQRDGKSLPTLSETATLLTQLSSALDYAHANQVIHRDLKPSNIMFDEHGHPYIVDFGIAKLVQSTSQLTKTGLAMGTPTYMPPEQWMSEAITPAADQYAMAIVIYQLISGEVPFTAENPFALMTKHTKDAPPLATEQNQRVPEAISVIVNRALSKDPKERYESMGAFAQEFKVAAEQTLPSDGATDFFTYQLTTQISTSKPTYRPDTAMPDSPTEVSGMQEAQNGSSMRNRATLIFAVAMLLLVIAGGAFAFYSANQDDADSTNNNDNNAAAVADNEETTQPTDAVSSETNSTPEASATPSDLPTDTPQPTDTTEPSPIPPSPTPQPTMIANASSLVNQFAVEDVQTSDYSFVGIFDDFEDSTDGTLNQARWQEDIVPDTCDYAIQDGVLQSSMTGDTNCRIRINSDQITLQDLGMFSADVMLPISDEGLNANTGLLLIPSDDTWGVYCGWDTRLDGPPTIRFFTYQDGTHFTDTSVEYAVNSMANIRLVYHLQHQAFSCYVDGDLIGTGDVPSDDGEVQEKPMYLILDSMRSDSNVNAEAMIDNVQFVAYVRHDYFNQEMFDTTRWLDLVDNTGCNIHHIDDENGLLAISNQAQNEFRKCAIIMTDELLLDQPIAVTASMLVQDDAGGQESNQGLIFINEDRDWWTYCGLDRRLDTDQLQARFNMHHINGNEDDFTLPATYGTLHNFRIEVEPLTFEVSCYMDEFLIGTMVAPDVNTLRTQQFDYGIENIRNDDSTTFGYADNFRYYPPQGTWLNETEPATNTNTDTTTDTSTDSGSNTGGQSSNDTVSPTQAPPPPTSAPQPTSPPSSGGDSEEDGEEEEQEGD